MGSSRLAKALGIVLGIVLLSRPAVAGTVPTLWGIDEDDGQLFAITDYMDASNTLVDYGKIKYNGSNVGAHIEAFTLDDKGTGYVAINKNFAGYNEPVLATFSIVGLTPGTAVDLNIVGRIDVNFNASEDNITGLGFDPYSGQLFGLFRDESAADKLFTLDPLTGATSGFTFMSGLGQSVTDGEDMHFDLQGNLFVADNKDDHLYKIDPNTGNIIALVDLNLGGGLGSGIKVEGLAVDPTNGNIIGFDDNRDQLVFITPGNGNNVLLADLTSKGITDAEGLHFVPTPNGQVPEPASMSLMALGGLLFLRRRRRESPAA